MGEVKQKLELVKSESGKRCRTCHHWHHQLDMPPEIGECHFNPPTCFLIMIPGRLQGQMDMQIRSQFPPTKATLSCGRWERDPNLPLELKEVEEEEGERDVVDINPA